METYAPHKLRALRSALIRASLVQPVAARSSYRCLRLGLNLGLLHHTWIDGKRCELPSQAPVAPLLAELESLGTDQLSELLLSTYPKITRRGLMEIAKRICGGALRVERGEELKRIAIE